MSFLQDDGTFLRLTFSFLKDDAAFSRLSEKYIEPIANTYAWVLMPNQFLLLIRVKSENEIGVYKDLNSDRSKDYVRFQIEADENPSESEGPDRVDNLTQIKNLTG